MRKRILIAAIICVALSTIVAITLLSCNGGGPVIITYIFRDNFTGQPIQGLTVIVNGETETSDAEGKITKELSDGLFKLYVDTGDLGVPAYEDPDGMRFYVEISASESFERILYLAPNELPTLDTNIIGTVEDKSGSLITDRTFSLYIYTADGRMVGREENISDPGGNYSTDIYGTGEFYFVVFDSGGPNYYTVINVTVDGTYDVAYGDTDLNFVGEGGDAEELCFDLVLGQELIELETFYLESPFDESVPHQGSDVLRFSTYKVDIGEYDDICYHYMDPKKYTSSASGLAPSFATGSTVGSSGQGWSDITWDAESRTATWKAAGNATLYLLLLFDAVESPPVLISFVQGTSLTVYPEVDLGAGIIEVFIMPIWSNGAGVGVYESMEELMGGAIQFLPADLMSGTAIIYWDLMDMWSAG